MSEIRELQDIVQNFIDKRDWNKFHSPKNIAMSIGIEVAELMEVFQWCSNEDCADPEFIEKYRKEIEDEVADVIIYTLSLVNICNLNLSEIVKRKMIRNETRFPVGKSKFD